MQQGEKLKAIRIALGREEFKKNNEYIFFCKNPQGCDGNHHNAKLSVNINTERYNCWVCGWSGKSLVGILKLGNRELFLKYLDGINKKDGRTGIQKTDDFVTAVLPKEFRSLSKSLVNPYWGSAVRYLEERGINKQDILKYKLGYCEDGEYRHRIIIPSFDLDGELNFFVGRTYYENAGISYKHGIFDKNIIFNDYMIDWNRPVVLVEGPFDMMKAGANAIPLQGSILPDKLLTKIVTLGTPVYIALDSDARKKQINYMQKFISHGVETHDIRVSNYGVNDVGEMSKDVFQLAKEEAVRVKSDIDLLRMRVTA